MRVTDAMRDWAKKVLETAGTELGYLSYGEKADLLQDQGTDQGVTVRDSDHAHYIIAAVELAAKEKESK